MPLEVMYNITPIHKTNQKYFSLLDIDRKVLYNQIKLIIPPKIGKVAAPNSLISSLS